MLYDLNTFFRLSGELNYMLSAGLVQGCLPVILDWKPVSDGDRTILLEMLDYLDKAYAGRRRLLGSLAILHPLRSAALLVRARGEPHLLDVMTELLHDKREDLPPSAELDARFQRLVQTVDPVSAWYLNERIDWLTRHEGEPYVAYMDRLLDHARGTPEVLRAKLADHLDNVMDLRIDAMDPMPIDQFDEIVFKVLFQRSFTGFRPGMVHPLPSPLNGAHRLYRLHKAATVLSLVRSHEVPLDDTAQRLFDAVAHAAKREAQRILLHIWGYHLRDVHSQRELLLRTMEYAQTGGLERVTEPSDANPLDGLFTTYFDPGDKDVRNARLNVLYADKPLMIQAALAFVAIFQLLLDDPRFRLEGLGGS